MALSRSKNAASRCACSWAQERLLAKRRCIGIMRTSSAAKTFHHSVPMSDAMSTFMRSGGLTSRWTRMRPSRGPRNPQASGTIVQVHQREQVARRVALYLLFNEGYHDPSKRQLFCLGESPRFVLIDDGRDQFAHTPTAPAISGSCTGCSSSGWKRCSSTPVTVITI